MGKISELPDDDDSRYFLRELQNTPIGSRYLQAIHVMRAATREIRTLVHMVATKEIPSAQADSKIEVWRSIYIDYSNRASAVLEELMEAYSWPPESADGQRFTEARVGALLKQGFKIVRISLPPKPDN